MLRFLWLTVGFFLSVGFSSTDTTIIQVTGSTLSKPAVVHRDAWGIPTIEAESDKDAYFALGYAMAQDKLWQMDFYRNVAGATLSEILPKTPAVAQSDSLFGYLAVRYYSEMKVKNLQKNPQYKPVLDALNAFVAGINLFIQENPNNWSKEFTVLKYAPKPFTILDCYLMMGAMAVNLNTPLSIEIPLAGIIGKVGLDRAMELFLYPPKNQKTLAQLNMPVKPLPNIPNMFLHGGSNSWVIDSEKSDSGKPVLANDPHLGLSLPAIFYEAHIKTPTLNFSGFFLPLIPFGVIGQNEHFAWGLTMVMVDGADFYFEKIKQEGSKYQYFYKKQWREAQVHTFRLAGKTISVPITAQGPVISPIFKAPKPISMRWSYYDEDNLPLVNFYLLNRAKNKQDIKQALKDYKEPAVNIVYIDSDDNIGYYAGVRIPIRAHEGEGLQIMDGTSGDFDWKGYVPLEDNPQIFNPKEGYIVTSNSEVVKNYPYYITIYWDAPQRGQRIKELLTQKETLTLKDHQAIQRDTLSKKAQILIPILLKAFESQEPSPLVKQALDILKQWDFHQPKDAIAPTIYNQWYYDLVYLILTDKLSSEQFDVLYKPSTVRTQFVTALLKNPKSSWWNLSSTPDVDTPSDVFMKAFQISMKNLSSKLGSKISSKWQWGQLQKLTFRHPIGAILPMFNKGPFGVGGNIDSVNRTIYPNNNTDQVASGPTMRMIIDFDQPFDAFLINHSGESGRVESPHYADQIPLWLNDDYRPRRTERKTQSLKLKPKH